jgi:hypothetical protein
MARILNKRQPSASEIPRNLRQFLISIEPFKVKVKRHNSALGIDVEEERTFKVVGTRSYVSVGVEDPATGEMIYSMRKDHAHHVKCLETDEMWWIPHDRVRQQQDAAGVKH